MKRGTDLKVKFKTLMHKLGLSSWQAKGVLQAMWDFTSENAPLGDIGRHCDEDIALGIDWPVDDAQRLVDGLVASKWIDRSEAHRLIVHDWHEHCEDWLKKRVQRSGQRFASDVVRHRPPSSDNGSPPEPEPDPDPKPEPAPEPTPEERDPSIVMDSDDPDFGVPRNTAYQANNRSLEAIRTEYPKHRQGGRAGDYPAIRDALERIASERDDPEKWLADRVKAFARSPAGKAGKFVPTLKTWMNDGRYDQPPEAWENDDAKAQRNSAADNPSRVKAEEGQYDDDEEDILRPDD